MVDITDRVLCKELRSKIVTAEEAAAFIKPGMSIGTSGFTPSGYPKAVPLALAERMKKDPFQINLWTGASVGPELDGALAAVDGIKFRMPYQTNKDIRKSINAGKINYCDLHLSESAQMARYGFMKGNKIDVAIVEACMITKEGYIVPTTSLGNAASYVKTADVVIVEVNTTQPLDLYGMHDVYVPDDPPYRMPLNVVAPDTRIGKPYIECPPSKIKYVVPCDIPDNARPLAASDDNARAMSSHFVEFLKNEVKEGRMPKNLLPLQSGVGNVANAVISGLANSDFEHMTVYTEVIQDGMFDLFDAGKLDFASGTSLTLSPDGQKRFYGDVEKYVPKIILRPEEISNSPEVARRIGVIAMNTAIEADIYGNVNSTRINGSRLMNGIGGSGDFARGGFMSVFFTVSTAKDGALSSIVPMVSHVDHIPQDVDVICTEQGLADLRGLSAKERARVIIDKCVHPDYKEQLNDYFKRACEATKNADTPHLLKEALSWHVNAMEKGTMKL
ncbi:MAG: acetyl-CoA hydrolase/transferase family protein [Selenomonadaceae bacterium]|jgi:succinyl-CoA:acetate CoA-transferase